MTRACDSVRIQDYLDGELAAPEREAFVAHLRDCAACATELALYRRTFAALDGMPLVAPPAALTERVLERVLPSRVRRRWAKVVGIGYAGVFAASVAFATFWVSQPAHRLLLMNVAGDLSKRIVEAMFFALNTVAFTVVSLVNGWGLVAAASERLAPLGRALGALLSNGAVQIALVTAAAACIALVWWIRPPRGKRTSGEVRHVGVLGF